MDSSLTFLSKKFTSRSCNDGDQLWFGPGDPYNAEPKALNANYRDVEATIIICNLLGQAGYKYLEDFYFVTCGLERVTIHFFNKQAMLHAALVWTDAISNETPPGGDHNEKWDNDE
jgi:hypothetical protein